MTNVVAFRRPLKRERSSTVPGGKTRVTGFAVSLQAAPGAVFLVTDHVELGLSPPQARELSNDLAELADDADPELRLLDALEVAIARAQAQVHRLQRKRRALLEAHRG